jgi:23S rRNA (pseudouridine1915-N3)-methyltransferase
MKVRLLAVGNRMPDWVQAGIADYAGRLAREWRFELVQIPAATRGKSGDAARWQKEEAAKLLKAVPAGAEVIAFDERGEMLSTLDWAASLKRLMQEGRDLCLLIGGPDGFAPEVLSRATRRWSLSKLTLPHALARVLVLEQLYRAWSLLANHPYHRA